MKAPLSWLKEYVDIQVTPKELVEKLVKIGFEVEELIYLGKDIENVVVGQITDIKKHDNSDHLLICKVQLKNEELQIVTGANNVFVGAKVPVAKVGAVLPNGINIKPTKLRGVDSFGMLVSGQELGIDDNWYKGASVNGILILNDDEELDADIKDVVGLNDYVLDISITANRPDCQSVFGIAREIASAYNLPIKMPELDYDTKKGSHSLKVSVLDSTLCPKYIAHLVENVMIKDSPLWLKRKLAKVGINSINNIVDITNYVLVELGQPMHAFDLKNLQGNKIVVRRAFDKEKIVTLDEKEFVLNENNLVICDAEKPVALAGIMGGLNSGIMPDTSTVVFELAKFARDNIRKTSRALGQSSDSSKKFEKGVDEYTVGLARKRALHLVQALNAGDVTDVEFDIVASNKQPQVLNTTISKINKVLGIEVPEDEVVGILRRLQFKVEKDGDNITITVPPFRDDIEDYPDLSEEVIRIYGYDHIVPSEFLNASITSGGLTSTQKDINKLKQLLVNNGYYETVSYSFFSEKDLNMFKYDKDADVRKAIKLLNPISEDLSILRRTIAPSLVNVIVRNMKRNNDSARVFELANIFIPYELPLTQLPKEELVLALGAYGEGEDFFTLKGVVESIQEVFDANFTFTKVNLPFLHPGRSANILLNGEVVGYIGQLAYDIIEDISATNNIYIAEINFTKITSINKAHLKFAPITKHLEIRRDIAVLVNKDVTHADIVDVIKNSVQYISNVELFDIYTGAQIDSNKKSMAYTITFTPKENAFSLEEIDGFINTVLTNLNKKLGAELRN